MYVEKVSGFDRLLRDGGQVEIAPGPLVLRTAPGIYCDGPSGLDDGGILGLFYEVEADEEISIRSLDGNDPS